MSNIKPKYTTVIHTSNGIRNGKSFDDPLELRARKYRFDKTHGKDTKSAMNIYEFTDGQYELLGVHKTNEPFELFIPKLGIMV